MTPAEAKAAVENFPNDQREMAYAISGRAMLKPESIKVSDYEVFTPSQREIVDIYVESSVIKWNSYTDAQREMLTDTFMLIHQFDADES